MKSCRRKNVRTVRYMLLSLLLLCGCEKQPEPISKVDTAMGTVVQETLYVTDVEKGEQAATEIISELNELEQEYLSWRLESSEIARLNAQAGKQEGFLLSQELSTDLERIWEVSKNSNGALDITVGQVTKLWNLDTFAKGQDAAQNGFEIPSEVAVQQVLSLTGYEKVTLKEGNIWLPEGMSLDLGAVGKGIACDRISDYLKDCEEIHGAVISVGGSIVTYGSKPDGSAFRVAIVHPREEGAFLGTLTLQGEWYVSTSGDYERYVEKDGIRYHHIMDPKTGYPADGGVLSVTILSKSGLLSDALSTACFVLGVEEGKKLAQEFGAEALFVTKELEMIYTDGMAQYFTSWEK